VADVGKHQVHVNLSKGCREEKCLVKGSLSFYRKDKLKSYDRTYGGNRVFLKTDFTTNDVIER
jgi:hypothetical protein